MSTYNSKPAREEIEGRLRALALPGESVDRWLDSAQRLAPLSDDWQADGQRLGRVIELAQAMLERLPARSQRSPTETAAADSLRRYSVESVREYSAAHGPALYAAARAAIEGPPRLEALCETLAQLLPGVFPSQMRLQAEAHHLQKDKDGLELYQGAVLAQWFADAATGTAIIEAMQAPLPQSQAQLQQLIDRGELDLGRVHIQVEGRLGRIELRHPDTLNAEDESTLPLFEQAVDLLLLHPRVQMGVLRGGRVEHPKYAGRRLFSAGINLTALYEGRQSYLWYIVRELGVLNKIYRGLRRDGQSHEIPWMAVVDGFAIGGGCQILLVVDHVIAERGAFFNLPARKEGIIPGCANLRLPHFIGLRAAQAAILFGREFSVDEPLAAGLINAVHDTGALDANIESTAALVLDSGMVSAAGNRRALRAATEPEAKFRNYMSLYAWEQAWCHLSPQLAENLERHWKKAQTQADRPESGAKP